MNFSEYSHIGDKLTHGGDLPILCHHHDHPHKQNYLNTIDINFLTFSIVSILIHYMLES